MSVWTMKPELLATVEGHLVDGDSVNWIRANRGHGEEWIEAAVRVGVVVPADRIRELHAPFRLYNTYSRDNQLGDATYVDGVGVVCEDEFLYEICRWCCADGMGEQSEVCAMYHDHGPGKPICPTIALIESLKTVSA